MIFLMEAESQVIEDNHHEISMDRNHSLVSEKGIHRPRNEISRTIVQTANFSKPKCSACNDEIQFIEGDIIYGDKWYHNLCWNANQEKKVAPH